MDKKANKSISGLWCHKETEVYFIFGHVFLFSSLFFHEWLFFYTINVNKYFYITFCFFLLLLQLAAIVLNFGVLVSSIYEGIYARRCGDPTKLREISDMRSTTINNPGYREHRHRTNGKIIFLILSMLC